MQTVSALSTTLSSSSKSAVPKSTSIMTASQIIQQSREWTTTEGHLDHRLCNSTDTCQHDVILQVMQHIHIISLRQSLAKEKNF